MRTDTFAARAWARLRRRPALPPRPTPTPLDPADLPPIACHHCGAAPVAGIEHHRDIPTARRKYTLTCGGCGRTYVETEAWPLVWLPDDYDQCPRCGARPTSGTVACQGEGWQELMVRRYHCGACDHRYTYCTDGG